jgi:hypothetical protein
MYNPRGMALEHGPRAALPWCRPNKEMSHGQWDQLSGRGYGALPNCFHEGSECAAPGYRYNGVWTKEGFINGHDQLLEYVPTHCKLPAIGEIEAVLAATLGPNRSLRFIGDSHSRQHYDSVSTCYLRCTGPSELAFKQLPDDLPDESWASHLVEEGGFASAAAHAAVAHLNTTAGANIWHRVGQKSHLGPECKHGSIAAFVDYRRVNLLPTDPAHVAAVMHALLYLGHRRLGYEDVVVMNLGLHYHAESNNRRHMLAPALEAMVKWWAAERAAGRAPLLLWRETGPQHFNTSDGGWPSPGEGALGMPQSRCAPLHGAKAARRIHSEISTNTMQRAATLYGWIGVMHIFSPSAVRLDEHSRVRFAPAYAMWTDCTHYCEPSSVLRLWIQVLLAALLSVTANSYNSSLPIYRPVLGSAFQRR